MKEERWQLWLSNRKRLEFDFNNYLKREVIRKIEPSPHLSEIHLSKAFHNLDFANHTLDNQDKINKRIEDETYYDWVIIISYYAMYHSAIALLYKLGFKTETHIATICVLCKKGLTKGLDKEDIQRIFNILTLSEEEIKEIGRAKGRREKANYSGSISFEKQLAEMTLDDARKFVNKIADMLGK